MADASCSHVANGAGCRRADGSGDKQGVGPFTQRALNEAFGFAGLAVTEAAIAAKELFSMRIDADVIEWFRSQGPGYQSQMYALLRAYMEAHK